MPKPLSIASATVATNAEDVLPRQLEALARQTAPLQEIIVIDNGSTDSTVAMLREKYPQVTVIELGANLGVGGAFSAGLEYAALKRKHDWVWLLDEDSTPDEDALRQLLQGVASAQAMGKNVGIVASVPFHGDSEVSYPGLIWRDRLLEPSANISSEKMWFVDATISSGSLIRREAVESVGLPRTDFFMDLVDVEYSLRVRRGGYDIGMVRDSILHHTIGEPVVFRFMGLKYAWSDHPAWRQYYVMRNHTYIIWHFYPGWKTKFFLLGRLIRHGLGILFFSRSRSQSISMMCRGFVDGRTGRLGITVSPDVAPPLNSQSERPLRPVVP